MKLNLFLSALAFLFGASTLFAQCKAYTKKNCLPGLSPYVHNGQYSGGVFMSGETAEMLYKFSSGITYRLLVCNQETIDKAIFRVLDTDKNELYNSEGKSNNFWDFQVENTQQLIVEVRIPQKKPVNNLVPAGCVSVMVGFKN